MLAAADDLYDRAAAGISRLPARARPGVHAARLLYAQIGHELRRRGMDAVTRRAHVSASRKLALALAAVGAALRANSVLAAAPLEQVRYLLRAVQEAGVPTDTPPAALAPSQSRAEWLIDLFERLQWREQTAAAQRLEQLQSYARQAARRARPARSIRNGSRVCTQRLRKRSRFRLSCTAVTARPAIRVESSERA